MESDENRTELRFCGSSGENEVPGTLCGHDRLKSKQFNKGLAFTLKERQLLGIQGLLPAVVKTRADQIEHTLILIDRLETNLDKYTFLNNLADHNERLFYDVLSADYGKLLPLVYTPVVGLGCQKFSLLFQSPRGMYITFKDRGHIYDVLKNWPRTEVRVICVTDGECILGLGDLGANGMGIPIGKLILYTALGGIPPKHCMPITLDMGTNTQSILNDPLYIGMRQKRISGPEYFAFVDEFMRAVVRRFGQNCLVQFEDLGSENAFKLLALYRQKYCVFNDDIQGTGCVVLAGLICALRIKNELMKNNRILLFGAGQAALGIAYMCVTNLKREGLSEDEARQCIWMFDSRGLIVKKRPAGGLTERKQHFARDQQPIKTLAEAVDVIKPTILIGVSTVGGAFTFEILQRMAELNKTPVIFALSNPTSKSECNAVNAYLYTKGRCIFASGSPFYPLTYEGRTFYPSRAHNACIFPGMGLGIIVSGMLTVPEELFLIAADRLSELCTAEDWAEGRIYPPLPRLAECAFEIALTVLEYAYRHGLATVRPEPKDKRAFIRSQMYIPAYSPVIPEVY